MTEQTTAPDSFIELENVIIRFAGDSGDGMQLTGSEFTRTSAMIGNDVSTLPEYPAEIRAPQGTLAGVSGFQVNFAARDVYTPGDAPRVLVAMNPAALKANLRDIEPGGIIIANTDAFTSNNLKKAGYATNPLTDGSLQSYTVIPVPITKTNREAVNDLSELSSKEKDRSQNFFALGLTFWIFDRPLDATLKWIDSKFAQKQPAVAEANRRALKAGYHFGETYEAFQVRYRIRPARMPDGLYRQITGNEALALGFVTIATRTGKPLCYNSYPITPASDLLHYLAAMKNFDVRTFQAEDEIAAMGATVGAAFGGALAVTGTSGPGIALKSEGLNLALMLELPMVIVNVARGGPSTGLPTKPEQTDLFQVMFGRNGESPLPVIAPASPADCFNAAIEAFRLAVRATVPVILLSDGFLANSAEPWLLPDPEDIEPLNITHPTAADLHGEKYKPYTRDPETLARPWGIPGTPGLEHRVGGLEKAHETGNVSYDPDNHQYMTHLRAEKVARLAEFIPEVKVHGPTSGDLLVVSWGGTYGAVHQAVQQAQHDGKSVAHVHLRHLNPFPRNLAAVLQNYQQILVPELNMGQLAFILRGRFGLGNVLQLNKVKGKPFMIAEIREKIDQILAAQAA